jgi:hypothetical protein
MGIPDMFLGLSDLIHVILDTAPARSGAPETGSHGCRHLVTGPAGA